MENEYIFTCLKFRHPETWKYLRLQQWHSASVTVGTQKIRIQFTLPPQQPTIKTSRGENRNLFFITMVAKR
jgi:hypothetical protein